MSDLILDKMMKIVLRQWPNVGVAREDEGRAVLDRELRALLAEVAIEYSTLFAVKPYGPHVPREIRKRFGVTQNEAGEA